MSLPVGFSILSSAHAAAISSPGPNFRVFDNSTALFTILSRSSLVTTNDVLTESIIIIRSFFKGTYLLSLALVYFAALQVVVQIPGYRSGFGAPLAVGILSIMSVIGVHILLRAFEWGAYSNAIIHYKSDPRLVKFAKEQTDIDMIRRLDKVCHMYTFENRMERRVENGREKDIEKPPTTIGQIVNAYRRHVERWMLVLLLSFVAIYSALVYFNLL